MPADRGAAMAAAPGTDDPEAAVFEADSRRVVSSGGAGAPELRLGAWEGPLDLLLELARARRVDLSRLSILDLAGQFGAALEAAVAQRRVPLSRLADWLVMAAHLAWLRSRLLLPEDSRDAEEGRREAEALRRRLADREHARRLADWLDRRPRLGSDVFARGWAVDGSGPHEQAVPQADIAALLRACLAVLEKEHGSGPYRPAPLPLWRVPDALARLRRMLPALPEHGAPLERFLPEQAGEGTGAELQRRAALASRLLAGLELAREGGAVLRQDARFGEVVVAPAGPPRAARGGTRTEVVGRVGRPRALPAEA